MPIIRYPEYQWDNNIAGIPANTNVDLGIIVSSSTDSVKLDGCRYVVRMVTSASTDSFVINEPAGKTYRI
jgi:hypothetical protein